MAKPLKSELHHWWPKCLSSFWVDEDGLVGRMMPNGEVLKCPPKNFGAINNAHHIKLDTEPHDWDESFEASFSIADNHFPKVVKWLLSLHRSSIDSEFFRNRLVTQPANDALIIKLVECMISLVVRAPRFRHFALAPAKEFRKEISAQEQNILVGYNIRNCQRMFADSIGSRGKFLVLFTENSEFIFGDGFYNTYNNTAFPPPLSPTILVPIVPNVSVLFSIPPICISEPRIATAVLRDEETNKLNEIVQIYSKDFVFFRSQKPQLSEHFQMGKFLEYNPEHDPVRELVRSLWDISEAPNFGLR